MNRLSSLSSTSNNVLVSFGVCITDPPAGRDRKIGRTGNGFGTYGSKIPFGARSAIADPRRAGEGAARGPTPHPGTFSGSAPLSLWMRRTPWFRALATCLAVWFPLVVGEPGVLRPCAMHGSAVGATAVPASGHSHHAAASAESGHGGHAPASAPTHQHHACTCIGACAGSAAVALTTSAPELPALTIAYRPASILPSGERLARPAPSFSRPYTTGPPRPC